MKKQTKYILAGLGLTLLGGVSYKQIIYGDIFDKVGDFFEDVGEKISNTFDDAINALKRTPACAEVVAKGIEWSAMRGSYEVAKGTLELSKTLQVLDPRISKLQTEIAGLETALTGIDATVAAGSAGVDVVAAAGSWGIQTISDVGNVVGTLLASGFNIQKLEFEINVADIKAGKLPMVGIGGVFAGKKIDTQLQLNFKDVKASLVSLAKSLKGIVAP